jgi:hypothetical protein
MLSKTLIAALTLGFTCAVYLLPTVNTNAEFRGGAILIISENTPSCNHCVQNNSLWSSLLFSRLPTSIWLGLMTFNSKPELVVDFTQDTARISSAFLNISSSTETEANTFDVIFEVIAKMSRLPGKNAVLLVGTVRDDYSRHSYGDTIKALGSAGIPFYFLDDAPLKTDRRQALELASASGGAVYFLNGVNMDPLDEFYRGMLTSIGPNTSTGTETPPKGKPAAEPTLAETVGFIREKLSSDGKAGFVAAMRDTVHSTNTSNIIAASVTGVIQNPKGCGLRYRWVVNRDGHTLTDEIVNLSFKGILKIEVMPVTDLLNRINPSEGHPELEAIGSKPATWALVVTHANSQRNVIYLEDENLADRIATAMTHAAELCGSSDSSEPF